MDVMPACWIPTGPAGLPLFSPFETSNRRSPSTKHVPDVFVAARLIWERHRLAVNEATVADITADEGQLTLNARLERVRYNIRIQQQKRQSESWPVAKRNQMCCKFCKKNSEEQAIVTHHTLKDATGIVTCPLLREYTCPICKATGEEAHTISHCPQVEAGRVSQVDVILGRYLNDHQNQLERGKTTFWCEPRYCSRDSGN